MPTSIMFSSLFNKGRSQKGVPRKLLTNDTKRRSSDGNRGDSWD